MFIAVLAVSHFVHDWTTHRRDLPLVPGVEVVHGLGPWNFPNRVDHAARAARADRSLGR